MKIALIRTVEAFSVFWIRMVKILAFGLVETQRAYYHLVITIFQGIFEVGVVFFSPRG